MNHLRAALSGANLAETAQAHAAGERLLLPRGEMEETQREHPGGVAQGHHQHRAPAPDDLGQQHFALDGGALPWLDRTDRQHAAAILVTRGQQQGEILHAAHAKTLQSRRERRPYPAQFSDRIVRRQRHAARPAIQRAGTSTASTSTRAPLGKAATCTVARAG